MSRSYDALFDGTEDQNQDDADWRQLLAMLAAEREAKEVAARSPETFRTNLRRVCERIGKRPAQIIKELNIPGPWFYRILSKGMVNIDKNTSPRIDRILRLEGSGLTIKDLWKPDPFPEHPEVHRQLDQLLGRPEFDWLPGFINMLHSRARFAKTSAMIDKLRNRKNG